MISKILTDHQINQIHETSLTILERVGVIVPHKEILRRFDDFGAKVDLNKQRVRIPANLTMQLLDKAGKQFTLYGRDLSRRAFFGYGKRNYNSIAGEASWLENIGKEHRYATLKDVAVASCFGDAMESINIVGAMSDPHEIPIEWRCVEVVSTMVRNTTKPVTFWFHDRGSAKYIVDMLIAIRGSVQKASEYPLFYPFLEPISPLHFPFHGIDLLFETARVNLPVPVGPMAQMGLSSPATIAATLAQENAEILAGICITQLVSPGMPVCYGGICHAFDMSTTQMIFGGPEQAIFGVAMTQIGKKYDLPVYINVGLTDSKRPDAQAGMEVGITLAMGAAAGADIFGHMGICGVDQAASLDILVLQNEVISYVESMMRQIDFSNNTFGFKEFEEVGPGGSFIDRMYTSEHFRKELWFPKLLDRNYYSSWFKSGCMSMEQRCRERKEEILKNRSSEPISKDLDHILNEIVAAAKKDLGKSANL